MFLGGRTTQAEYFDSERPPEELAEFFNSLGRMNRFFMFAEPFQRFLPRLLESSSCARLSILDLGAGDGSLGKALADWAGKRGWIWRFTNLDSNPASLRLNPEGLNVAGSVVALPFRNDSFDVVIASQMTHHLNDGEARQHLREAWRVTRRALFLSDLHRNAGLYFILWAVCRLRRVRPSFKADALLSVQRAWRIPELRRLADQAGIEGARVRLHFGARVLLGACKRLP
jgi:SAM-dependent methyltransferase